MQAKLYRKSRITFRTNSKIAILKSAVQSNPKSSYSFALSIAELMNSIEGFFPLGFSYAKKSDSSLHKPTKNDKMENYYEPWCDYIFRLVCEEQIVVVGDQVVLMGTICEDSFCAIENSDLFDIKAYVFSGQEDLAHFEMIELIKGKKIHETPERKRKIGIINFSTQTICKDKFKPKMHIEGILSGIFYNPGDEWHSFHILANKIPTLQDLQSYNTIILTGSTYSVEKMAQEMLKFRQILIEALRLNKSLKVIGLCFGHQFLAHMQGIGITAKPLNKGPWNINFQIQNEEELPYLSEFTKSEYRFLRLYKYHNDHVNAVPQEYRQFGTSTKCERQSFISKDKRILSFQSHPEYTQQYVYGYEYRSGQSQIQRLVPLDEFHHKSIDIIRRTMRNFMDWSV